jgi:4-hydroxy-3-methylbut-2-enyl diphosphate reductase
LKIKQNISVKKTENKVSQIILAQPRGFCAGVERAIEIVEKAIAKYGAPIYVRHEIVHNKYVVDDLKKKGAIFVQEVDEIPTGAVTIFSAHGVAELVEINAEKRKLHVIDATCPLVKKVHNEAVKYEQDANQIILIGHAGHPEVEGTSGRVVSEVLLVENVADVAKLKVINPAKLAYVTQTTLSVSDTKEIIEALKKSFPLIQGPDTKDICYATQNRQDAVRELAKQVELLLVIGAPNSSNSNRLRDIGEENNVASYLIRDKEDIQQEWLVNNPKIGITAGASAPEILINSVVDYLSSLRQVDVVTLDGVHENIFFNIPRELR